MIDLAPLRTPLASAASPSLAASDPRLDEIVTLADRNQLRESAELAQTVWESGVHDVRILGFYLCGAFLQSGLSALPAICQALGTLLGPSWPSLGPDQNKERYAEGALRWLFTTITTQLRFAQRAQKEPWQAILTAWAALPQTELFSLLERTAGTLGDVLGSEGAKSVSLGLLTWLRTLPAKSEAKPAAGIEGVGSTDRAEPANTPAANEGEDAVLSPEAATRASTPSAAGGSPSLVVPLSPSMQRLLRKLDAFSRLVALGKFRHAAIVYKDIQASIGSFDPRQYFPSLFGDYYGHVVAHADKLTKHLGEDKGFMSDALRELYQTDLELFVTSKG